LRVLTVLDRDAEKSAFAVAVEAGSLEDPADFQGLAHFCEHMLFLGSDKYPDQDAFSRQLALHDGNHNAYTSAEETVYFNEIGNEGLDKGMDIFAQFFIAPTFQTGMVDKEIHAVDSEHMKYKPDTQRRLWHLLYSIANPENPSHQFATGDLETLKTRPEKEGKSLVEALHLFHKQNYCVNRMTLVLVMNKSNDEQLELAHKHFDNLPKATAESCPPRPRYVDKTPFSLELGNLGRQLTIATPGSPEMWLFFPMPDLKKNYKNQAESYLWHVLGHYGQGGLKALLQEEDLSHSFSYSGHSTVAGSAIIVTFSLTEKGAKDPSAIMQHFFAYLDVVRKAGVDKTIIDNMKQMRQVQFDYQEKQASEFNFVSSLAGSAPHYAPEDVLTGGFLLDTPSVELTTEVLSKLTADNMNIALVLPTFDEKTGNAHEKYYDFKYDNVAIDSKLIESLKQASDARLAVPPNLLYVPRKLDLITEGSGDNGPNQLMKQGRLELWWQGMAEAKLPKAIVQMRIGYSSKIISSVEGSVLAGIHARLVQQVLEEPADPLLSCGVSYSVSPTSDGMGVSFEGFDEHLIELVKLVLPVVRKPKYTAEAFEMLRRQLLLDISDVTKSEPYQHALEAFNLVTVNGHFSRLELTSAADDSKAVNPEAHAKFLEEMFADAELSLMFTGNIGTERAQEMTKVMENLLGITREQPPVEHQGSLQVLNPKEDVEVRMKNPIAKDPNSATLVTYQFGVPDVADRIHLTMLNSIINRPVFEDLRTKHQLGYVVFGNVAPHLSIVEVRVIVQGFRKNPDEVEVLIENTVQNLTSRIAALDHEEFVTRKDSLRVSLEKKDSTMSAVAGRYWGQIWDRTYCFNKTKMSLAYLNSPSFNSSKALLTAWKQAVAPNAHRRKVTVKLFGEPQESEASGGNVSTNLIEAVETTGAKKVIKLLDSTAVSSALKGEETWPNEYICHSSL
jgi:insulysin